MKLSIAVCLTLTMLTELVAARLCNGDYNYCGSTLIKMSTQPRNERLARVCFR